MGLKKNTTTTSRKRTTTKMAFKRTTTSTALKRITTTVSRRTTTSTTFKGITMTTVFKGTPALKGVASASSFQPPTANVVLPRPTIGRNDRSRCPRNRFTALSRFIMNGRDFRREIIKSDKMGLAETRIDKNRLG